MYINLCHIQYRRINCIFSKAMLTWFFSYICTVYAVHFVYIIGVLAFGFDIEFKFTPPTVSEFDLNHALRLSPS